MNRYSVVIHFELLGATPLPHTVFIPRIYAILKGNCPASLLLEHDSVKALPPEINPATPAIDYAYGFKVASDHDVFAVRNALKLVRSHLERGLEYLELLGGVNMHFSALNNLNAVDTIFVD
jgi:hypothetical protein